MVYKKEKTSQEWDQIRFRNSLGPQIGGLIHDAVAIVVADLKAGQGTDPKEVIEKNIKEWLDILYDIAESKKAELTEIKPVDKKAGKKLWDEKKEQIYQKDSELEEINKEAQKAEKTYNTPIDKESE